MVRLALAGFADKALVRDPVDTVIGGERKSPARGGNVASVSHLTGQIQCKVARGAVDDLAHALDAAHGAGSGARGASSKVSPTERFSILFEIADGMEATLDRVGMVETIDDRRPFRETPAADNSCLIDHFRQFAGCVRAQEGSIGAVVHPRAGIAHGNRRMMLDHDPQTRHLQVRYSPQALDFFRVRSSPSPRCQRRGAAP